MLVAAIVTSGMIPRPPLPTSALLKGFYEKFPRFKINEIFFAGESCGGIDVPLLGEVILNDKSDLKEYLSGIAVGKGVLGT
mmetsp:Transcript_4628/g.6931  ORF Transcript_4628/g.6931 Transcript_4628/m.6931 type:complete len:81 (+) Transcript_4628:622-864(+)